MNLSNLDRSGWQFSKLPTTNFFILPVLAWVPLTYDASQVLWRGLELGWGFWTFRFVLVTVLPGAMPEEIAWKNYLAWYQGVFKTSLNLTEIQNFIGKKKHWQVFLRHGGLRSYYGKLLLARAYQGSMPGL